MLQSFGTSFVAALFLILLQPPRASAQAKTTRVFFLENARKKQWCAFSDQQAWKAEAQDAWSNRTGAITYSSGQLSRIELTEVDESGDWAVNDSYYFDARRQIARLSRTINVIPDDTSTLESFSISKGKSTLMEIATKRISTGKSIPVPAPIWPELPIETRLEAFGFAGLVSKATNVQDKVCVPSHEAQ
jgi:hypothetical protein